MEKALSSPVEQQARYILENLPPEGLFAGHQWRISPFPFILSPDQVQELETLGRVLLQFYRAGNLLYRQSLSGKQPAWPAQWLDQGKPPALLDWARHDGFKNHIPRVIRPDLLVTENGFRITELDSVPGGIGLTAWLNRTYAQTQARFQPTSPSDPQTDADHGEFSWMKKSIVGGAEGMVEGFAAIFPPGPVKVMVSEESSTYRPEMEWLCQHLGSRFTVCDGNFTGIQAGDSVYRFFELFDLPNVPAAQSVLERAANKEIFLTPPPKPFLEEKLFLGLLWNRNLHNFWHQELGGGFFQRLKELVPYTWVVEPSPLPPQGAYPEINLTDWNQLKNLSQKERELVLKISGFSELAWGSRGVSVGNDLAQGQWAQAVDEALSSFDKNPYILQRFHRPRMIQSRWFDFEKGELKEMGSRVRLCPYYFVVGEGDAARTRLGGVLATLVPADKKVVHGMRDAVLVPCVV